MHTPLGAPSTCLQRPQRRASRAAGGKKRLRYNEDSDGGDDEEEDAEGAHRAAQAEAAFYAVRPLPCGS